MAGSRRDDHHRDTEGTEKGSFSKTRFFSVLSVSLYYDQTGLAVISGCRLNVVFGCGYAALW